MNIKTLAVALGAVVGLSANASAQTYTFGANPQGSIFYTTAAAISKVMVEKTGLQFRVAPYSGSSTYIPLVDKGEVAFGMSNGAEYAFAYDGKELFDTPHKNLRSVLTAFPTNSGFAVKADSPMKTVADLKGKKVVGGYSSGLIFNYLQNAALATAGLSTKDLEIVPSPNFVAGVKVFMAGRADAGYIPLNSGIGKQAMAKIPGGWKYLTFDGSDEAAKKMAVALPTSRPGKVSPGKNAPGVVADPTHMVQIDFTVFTGAHVPDDVVYKVVKTVYENKPDLIKALGAFNRFNPKGMAREHPVPYHPGAIKAYKELGMWPPK